MNVVVGNKSLKCGAVLFAFLCGDKNSDQNQPRGGKGLLYLLGYSSSQSEARAEIELSRTRGMPLTGWLAILLAHLGFVYNPGPPPAED